MQRLNPLDGEIHKLVPGTPEERRAAGEAGTRVYANRALVYDPRMQNAVELRDGTVSLARQKAAVAEPLRTDPPLTGIPPVGWPSILLSPANPDYS